MTHVKVPVLQLIAGGVTGPSEVAALLDDCPILHQNITKAPGVQSGLIMLWPEELLLVLYL